MTGHALHFDPDCEECVYLARPVAIPVPAQEERLREALEQIAHLGPLGPFRVVGDELAAAQDIARRALGVEPKEGG